VPALRQLLSEFYMEERVGKIMLKNMKIGKKLIISFVLITFLSSFSGVVGFIIMRTMNQQYSGALVQYGFAQGDIGLFNTEFNNNNVIMRDIIIQPGVNERLKSKEELDQSSAKLVQYLTKMKSGIIGSKEQGYYDTIMSDLQEYTVARDQTVQLAISGKDTDAYIMMFQKCSPLSLELRTAIDSLVTEKTNSGNQLSKSLTAQGERAYVIMSAILLISILLSVLIAVFISRGISRPVSELLSAARKMAEGDLKVRVKVKSRDEIGQLGNAFAETIETLNQYITDIQSTLLQVEQGDLNVARRFEYKGDFIQLQKSIEAIILFINDTITQMQQASQQVAGGSEQLSSGAQELAQGATEQVNSVERLSAAVAEISAQVKENAEHAEKASANVEDVNSEIEICNQHMQKMVQAISGIHDSSQQIGKIIKTIEDIAFQTNILALNAAVEAARAGSAGKGFAVVADEVRNLAGKSAEAAKDTTSLIHNSIGEVKNGTVIADETAKYLLHVVESTKAVSEIVGHISKASVRQSDAVEQVNRDVERISSVIQTNSATAEESAAASEELSGQAQIMKALAEQFKLRVEAAGQNQAEDEEPENTVSEIAMRQAASV